MITPQDFKRIENNVNGNPRYVIHFLNLLSDKENTGRIPDKYNRAVEKAKDIGGKRYHTRAYGGGIVFSTYSIHDLCKKLNLLVYGKDK